jgi:hypothetical protein
MSGSKTAWQVVLEYIESVREELADRVKQWRFDVDATEVQEAIGGLLARQVTLAIQLASAPQIWNGHIAPLILRTMTDCHISLAWIFENPVPRARMYIHHGLGQKKLWMEHLKENLKSKGTEKPEEHPVIRATETWINKQRFHFLTEVNVGSWSEIDTRRMAEETGCLDFYRFAYTPFSAATHNMWHHVVDYNLRECTNPLHRPHRIPYLPELDADIDYVYRAAKYVDKTFTLFDRKTGLCSQKPSSFRMFVKGLQQAEKEPTAKS